MPVAFHLETEMKAFRDSIPLLLDLKNEALRERFALIYLNTLPICRKIFFCFVRTFNFSYWGRAMSCSLKLHFLLNELV